MISRRQLGVASDTGRIFSSVVRGCVRGHIVLGFWRVGLFAVLAQKHATMFGAVDFPNKGVVSTTGTRANFYSVACPSFTGVSL